MSGDTTESSKNMSNKEIRPGSEKPRRTLSIRERLAMLTAASALGLTSLFPSATSAKDSQYAVQPRVERAGAPNLQVDEDTYSAISPDAIEKTPVPKPTATPVVTEAPQAVAQLKLPTATPSPTATEVAPALTETEAVTYTEVIVLKNANLRSGPGTSFPLVGSAAQGETLNVAFGSDGWAVLESTDGDVERFIFGEVVKPTVESVSPTDSMGTGGPVSSDTTDGAEAENPASGLEAPALDGAFHISSLDEAKFIPPDAAAVEFESGTDPEMNDILKTLGELGIDDTFYMSSLEGQTTLHVGMQSDLPWMNELFNSSVLSPESMNYILEFLAGMLDKNGKSLGDYTDVVILVRTDFTADGLRKYYKGSSTTDDSTVGERLTELRNQQSNVAAITSSFTDQLGEKFTTGAVVAISDSGGVLFFVALTGETHSSRRDAILAENNPMKAATLGISYAQAAIIDGTPFASSDGGVDGNPTENTATKLLDQSNEVIQSLEDIIPTVFITER